MALLGVLLVPILLGIPLTWLVVEHFRLRRSAIAEEYQLLKLSKLNDTISLPHVLVQIPTYNEGPLVLRALEAMAALDWPRDKLHIQLLDDSTDDESLRLAETAVRESVSRGIDAVLLHRIDRIGFKAGALGCGLLVSDHPFVAIFDADYVPPPHFLRDCIGLMLAEPRLALVQARCDYLNGDENLLTQVQQRVLDAHFVVEQATRSWIGQILPFNGTCGVWRRAAIDDAGGWHGDTLAEDLDLSYRVQLCGWQARYLVTLAVPGELPTTLWAWRTQQFRWAKGFTEVGRKLWWALWRSDLPFRRKIVAQRHLLESFQEPAILLGIALFVIDLQIGVGFTWSACFLFVLALLQEAFIGISQLLLGQQTARGGTLWRELAWTPVIVGFFVFVLVLNLRSNFEALIGRSTAFVRTPKKRTLPVS
jgi:cellulose synthase/poly-beta-1,6-N-acetylglucosamine synthase-like glycosyltransferase